MLLASCATTPVAPARSNAEFVRTLYDAFAKGDVPGVLGTFDPNIVWNNAESSPYADRNPYRGVPAIAEGIFQRLGGEWEYFRVKPEQFVDGGDVVVVLGRYEAKYRKTGRPLDAQFAHVWWLRDGKVTRLQQYTDTAQFARVTGL